ncbi:uncharacterized protein L969DRAFT_53668 [Mixia osmundae IAM 14324]|uniref:histidine kinase n=1 Tax=Mixia osmundae (strain CBS 9802 / IAM 14324 / JCM 22182 / KY 12970) TaxID=764103 RepID=G7DSU0_MIXOS|nr:uncharacterized protein L969DRAFT_53668 [Mixia osmundae IAM 14324]KEI37110.1 hypothetical protein L969DRAFT_53668 [Mixia osmundae IAM 14324]GAA93650.1 hypothetical protein E5Q_00295 [Mixia osmundae IAM 14324]
MDPKSELFSSQRRSPPAESSSSANSEAGDPPERDPDAAHSQPSPLSVPLESPLLELDAMRSMDITPLASDKAEPADPLDEQARAEMAPLPICSFLEAYADPAFILDVKTLAENLTERLVVKRQFDPEEAGHVNKKLTFHGEAAARDKALVDYQRFLSDAQRRRESVTLTPSPGHVPEGSSTSNGTTFPGMSVDSDQQQIKQRRDAFAQSRTRSDNSDSTTVGSNVAPKTDSSDSMIAQQSFSTTPQSHERSWQDQSVFLAMRQKEAQADRILSEAFMPSSEEAQTDSSAPSMLATESATLRSDAVAGHYPFITGAAADRGWTAPLHQVLRPLWANSAWDKLLQTMGVDNRPDSTEGLLDLLSLSDGQKLTDYLGALVRYHTDLTHGARSDLPRLGSIRLLLTPHRSVVSSYLSSDEGTDEEDSLPEDRRRKSPSPAPGSRETARHLALARVRVELDLTATIYVDEANTAKSLAIPHVVVTTTVHNMPVRLLRAARPPLRTQTSTDQLSTDSWSSNSTEENLPSDPTAVDQSTVPAGFVVESLSNRSSRRSGRRNSNDQNSLTDEDIEESLLSGEMPGTDFMDIGALKRHAREVKYSDARSKPEALLMAVTHADMTRYISTTELRLDPFCTYLATIGMGRLILAYPWHETSLGPLLSWAPELKVLVTMLLASPFREALWVGSEGVMIYNDAYVKTAGRKHPTLLGQAGAKGWEEIWETIEPSVRRVKAGETVAAYDNLLFMNRSPDDPLGIRREETYHIWALIPALGPNGNYIAAHNPSFETTSRVIAERRLGTLRNFVTKTSQARSVSEFFDATLSSLSQNPYDVPFLVCYTCNLDVTTKKKQRHATGLMPDQPEEKSSVLLLGLQGTLGVPEGHAACPKELSFPWDGQDSSDQGSMSETDSSTASSATAKQSYTADDKSYWPLHEACITGKPIFMPNLGTRNDDFEIRGWDEKARAAVVIPIQTDSRSAPHAVFVLGLNPRRPFDEAYANWLQLMSKQIATQVVIVKGYEVEMVKAQELAMLDRAKTAFFSNVNHELRTPLTLILGPLDDILGDKAEELAPTVRDRLRLVSRNAHRLLTLVNSLLDFSRLEAGKMQMAARKVDFAAMTADLASLFRSAIERGHVQYLVQIPEREVEVYLDPELYEKVVFNLVGNAFKYCLSGTITVTVRATKQAALLMVTDTGVGIAESELKHIFDRFHRVESTSRTQEGTGIGLALTMEIVQLMGGTIEATSVLHKGSTFTVSIPLGTAHIPAGHIAMEEEEPTTLGVKRMPKDTAIVDEAGRWASFGANTVLVSPAASNNSDQLQSEGTGSGSGSGSDGFNGPVTDDVLSINNSVIVLADDNPDMRKYCLSILGKKFKVVECGDGQSALDYARRYPPDMVISDIMMPRLGGYGLLKSLRDDPVTSLVPVILLSARAGTEARVDGLLAGADDYLAKPFSSKELLARVNTHLQLGKMRRELEKRVQERTRALVESEIRYRNLAEEYSAVTNMSPVGIYSMTATGSVIFTNKTWYDISGHPPDRHLDEWPLSIHPEDRPELLAAWAEAVANQVPCMREFRWLHGGHTLCDVRPQFDRSGVLTSWVGSLTNIEERRRLEILHLRAVEQRAEDAEEMRRQQELFIDITSHEMRNLGSGIYQNAELIGGSLERLSQIITGVRQGLTFEAAQMDHCTSEIEQNADAVDSIILCVSHQGRIADDILNYSKLSMGLLSISKIDFPLVSRLRNVLKMFEIESSQKQIELSLSVGPGINELGVEWVSADPNRLAQVLINFLTNAMRFTAESATRRIVMKLDASASMPLKSPTAMRVAEPAKTDLPPDAVWLTVGISDTGRGLTASERLKLFERFAQANPKKDGVAGFGLGLFVSRKIVEFHDGFIELESERGTGSTFSLSIPARRVAPVEDAEGSTQIASRVVGRSIRTIPAVRRPTLPTSPTKALSPSPPVAVDESTGLHVLIVEDNPINVRVLQRQLTNNGYATSTAENGQIAIDFLLKTHANPNLRPIDAVLMDIEMPVKDGLTAIKEIRELEAKGLLRPPPVIAVTGNARQAQVSACRQAGFRHGIAIKPYRIKELLTLIEIARASPDEALDPAADAAMSTQ